MPAKTLAEYLDQAMVKAGTDSMKLQRDHGLPASWTRNLKSGRIKGRPDEDRMTTLARALSVPEVELWKYLGRFDRVAVLRGEVPPGMEEPPPPWAVELMRQVADLSRKLDLLTAAREGIEEGERRALEAAGAVRLPDAGPARSNAPRPRGTRRVSPP